MKAAQDLDKVYDSVDDLATAWHASMATLTAIPEFHEWKRSNPTLKPLLAGSLWTPQGPRRITALLDTCATHCFICARLAAGFGLQPSGQPGPTSVSTAATGEAQGHVAPVLIHLSLGDMFRESLLVSPMDLDVGADLILGCDWILSHDLRHLYADGQVRFLSGPALLLLGLLQASARLATRSLPVIGHGEFRRLLWQLAPELPAGADSPPVLTTPPPPTPPLSSTGRSRPPHVDHRHAELAAAEAARARRHPGRPPEPRYIGHFPDGVEMLKDAMELHLASFCMADAELRLTGADDSAFAVLKIQYAVLGGAPSGMPPDRCMELELETGDAPMPWSRPVKRLSDGELAELRAQLIDLLDRVWIQHSTAGHAAAVVFTRKPDGSWLICYDYQGLNAITRQAVEPLPHIDALLDGTRGTRFFTKLDLASSNHQLRVQARDRWKTSFQSQLGQFELNGSRSACRGPPCS